MKTNYPSVGLSVGSDTNFNPILRANGSQIWPANSISNIVFTNTTTLSPGSSAYVTNTGVSNGIAYFIAGIPTGATGPQGPPATNAIYPTPEFTLTNINPLLCTGSNYIGYFPQLYDALLLLPNTASGLSPGSNLNETVMASFDATNWFAVTNSPVALFTNIYVAVVGDNNTNYAGAITLYGLTNWQYYGTTNWLIGQHLFANDPTAAFDVVNLESMQTAIANATASSWMLFNDAPGNTHYAYVPSGQPDLDLVLPPPATSYAVSFRNVSTNWVLGETNVLAGYQLQVSTNLGLRFGWTILATNLYSVSTNLFAATNIWTFTIPKANVPASYAFFRIVYYGHTSALFGGLPVLTPLTITNATDSTFGWGAGVICVDSNYVYVSVGTNLWKRSALSSW
ncbi:MAG: hypothetical protein KGL39_50885 [Patescibacteria group bacterium]|nr:hypothetical protein [Patescibacteria group bacterium]